MRSAAVRGLDASGCLPWAARFCGAAGRMAARMAGRKDLKMSAGGTLLETPNANERLQRGHDGTTIKTGKCTGGADVPKRQVRAVSVQAKPPVLWHQHLRRTITLIGLQTLRAARQGLGA